MNKFITIWLAITVTGCASITGSKLQPVSVQTVYDNKEVAGVGCTLSNDTGKWFVTSPGSVTIQKSTGDLAVDCKKDDTVVGHETVVSKSNGSVWGNILAGGIIGYAVDRNTGAGFDYPNSITVILHKIGEAIGISAPPPHSPGPTATSTSSSTSVTTNQTAVPISATSSAASAPEVTSKPGEPTSTTSK